MISISEYLMYLRKSRQDDPNETIEEVLSKHESILQEYALKNFGYRIPDKDIYREVVSGETIEDRPMIKELFKRLEQEPNIKGVLVIDVQRLTRGDMLECGITLHSLMYTNTLVITPQITFNLENKYDRKFFEMELSKGSDYLDYTKEILARGRNASVKRGNFINSQAPFGYDRVKIGKDWTLKINEYEAYYVRMIYDMYLEGYGCTLIEHKLNELGVKPKRAKYWTEITVRKILDNVVYVGKIKWKYTHSIKVIENGKVVTKRVPNENYEVYEGKHPSIIDDETFKKVQERRGLTSKENTKYELKFIYSGLIKCGKCGKAIKLQTYRHKDGVVYRKARVKCTAMSHCSNRSNNYDEVNNAIIEQLKLALEDFSIKVDINNSEDKNKRDNLLKTLKKQYDEVLKKEEKICDYLESGVYTTEMFIKRKNKIEEEKTTLENAIKKAESETTSTQDMKDKIVSLHQAIDMLNDDSISAKTKNTFLKKIIDVIYYEKNGKDVSLDIHLK
jgi:hypothetical protein